MLDYSKHCYYYQRVEDNLGTMLAQVSRLLRRNFDERARAIGVTRPQWQVLSVLKRSAGINQGGLAEILEVEPITAGRMIDRLQDADLVERRPDPSDRRAWRLYLTARGEELLKHLRPFADAAIEGALEGVSQAEREQLMAVLARIRNNLSRRTPVEVVANG
jgi:DNA-binding MarR family transcriptional regulator